MADAAERFDRSEADVRELMRTLSNWGRWGADDERGALNHITPEVRRRAAGLVREGTVVAASRPLPTETAADNPIPVRHLMVKSGLDRESFSSGDYFAVSPHGYATTHLDALCHVFDGGVMWGGVPREKVTSFGAERNAIDAVSEGIFTRGVLLDIARLRGAEWLEPGDAIFPDDLEAAEERAGLQVETGDFLLIRTGRWPYRAARGPWDASTRLAGLHASCLDWLHARQVAALGCDGVSDCIPSRVERVRMPIHLVAIVAMGLHLLDNADLEPLGAACAERRRWEFLFVVAPLVLRHGTGSPVTPLAIF
jgi:kynurenine formamidase